MSSKASLKFSNTWYYHYKCQFYLRLIGHSVKTVNYNVYLETIEKQLCLDERFRCFWIANQVTCNIISFFRNSSIKQPPSTTSNYACPCPCSLINFLPLCQCQWIKAVHHHLIGKYTLVWKNQCVFLVNRFWLTFPSKNTQLLWGYHATCNFHIMINGYICITAITNQNIT